MPLGGGQTETWQRKSQLEMLSEAAAGGPLPHVPGDCNHAGGMETPCFLLAQASACLS